MTLQTILRAALATALLTACGAQASTSATAATDAPAAAATVATTAGATQTASGPKIRIATSDGTIVAVLDPVHAPKTTANFLKYVDRKFFDGGTFFRAIPGFVIQGGNKTKETTQDLAPIALEDPKSTHLLNTNGALAMARTSDPNSATSEFFIDDGAQSALDGPPGQPGYAVFGHVVSGMDVVKKIVSGPAQDEMLTAPVTILKIERVK